MGYNKENFRRIRAEYATKAMRAQEAAEMRRAEVYRAIPELKELDAQLSTFGVRILQNAMNEGNVQSGILELRAENERIVAMRRTLLVQNGFPEDYTCPQYECDHCRDTGYVGIKMCACMRRALVAAGMQSSGLSALLRKQSFETFSMDYYRARPEEYQAMSENYRNLREYAHSFSIESGKPMPSSLLFLGGTGLGKTHLSTAIARVVIERGYDVFYNSAVGMISDFEIRRFGNGIAAEGTDDTERYVDCDLLIIDDLGTEVVNQFTLSCLYHVLNTRLNLEKPTIVSTNLMPAELRKLYSDRIASRLTGEFQVVPFYGTDVRKQKIANKK